jgi:GNAT superfamily N-acetyltransferase
MAILVRRVESGDIEPLLDLFEAVAAERIYIGTEPGFDREQKRRGFASRVDNDANPSFVTVVEGVVVGSASIGTHPEFGPTIGMLLAKTHRRHGIGRAMMAALDEWARTRPVTALHLMVFPHNESAIAFYRETGWVEVDRFENDVTRQNGEVWDTILMRKAYA